MKKFLGCLAIIAAITLCGAELGRTQAPEIGLIYKPGDKVRVSASFKAPITLDGGRFFFGLQGGLGKNQTGFATQFGGNELKKISETEYELTGQIAPDIASGSWRLEILDFSTEGVSRRYSFGTDFKKEIIIQIQNPKHVEFPEIKELTVNPPKS